MASVQVGFDVGTIDSVVALAVPASAEDMARGAPLRTHMAPSIARNDLSNHSTPSMVSFSGRRRCVGEEAANNYGMNPKNAILDFPRLLGRSGSDYAALAAGWSHFTVSDDADSGGPVVPVEFNNATTKVLVPHAAAMLLASMRTFADKDIAGLPGSPGAQYTFAVPACFGPAQRRALLDAAAIAGMEADKVSIVDSLSACAAVYASKHEAALPAPGETPAYVALVDMGAQHTNAGIFAFNRGQGAKPLARVSTATLGGLDLDHRLFDHCAAVCSSTHGITVDRGSKGGVRVLSACEKAKKVLSTVADTRVDLENVAPEKDVSIEVSQAAFRDMCGPELARLRSLLTDLHMAASSAGCGELRSIEVVGGCTRVPFVLSTIAEVLGDKIGKTLDSSHAVAMGAATIGALREAATLLAARVGPATEAAARAQGVAADVAAKLAEAEAAEAAAKDAAEAAAKAAAEAAKEKDGEAGEGEGTEASSAAAPPPAAATPPPAVDYALRRSATVAKEAAERALAEADVLRADVAAAEAARSGFVAGDVDGPEAVAADGAVVVAGTAGGAGSDAAPSAAADSGDGGLPAAAIEAARALEAEIVAQASALSGASDARYGLQSFVFEMRDQMSSEFGEHLPEDTAGATLAEAESFLESVQTRMEDLEWSDDPVHTVNAGLLAIAQECKDRLTQLQDKLREDHPAYYEAVTRKEAALNAELEAEQKAREAEEAAEAAAGNGDDHDRRKLRTAERLRIMTKNKDEGNELFRDGNVQAAAMRYVKALNHATKFFDVKDEEKADVDACKTSCYLNLAMCYIKLEQYQKALENCKSALFIDPESPKALYRAALACDKLNDVDKCEEYLKQATKVAPEDKNIAKLGKRVAAIRSKQKAKAKKMAQKMFS